jgi:DNA-binding response OmpR family regulator
MSFTPSILIIEDEEPIRRGLTNLFIYHGYKVDTAADGENGLRLALEKHYNLLIIDVMLPRMDGFQICNEIRMRDREIAIIMLTAKTSEEDIITGLRLGADDYVTKPFSVEELVLRVEAVLRRTKILDPAAKEINLGDRLSIDLVNLHGTQHNPEDEDTPKIEFTRREADILSYLCLNQHRAVSRGELLLEVWGYSKANKIETRTVDIHIAKLRKKIEIDPKDPQYLVTVWGEGYQLLCGNSCNE